MATLVYKLDSWSLTRSRGNFATPEDMAYSMGDRYFDENGNIYHRGLVRTLTNSIVEDATDWEFRVLAQLFSHPHVSNDDIVQILGGLSQAIAPRAHERLSLGLFSKDDNPLPHWGNGAIEKLYNYFSVATIAMANDLWATGRGIGDTTDLAQLLQRAQLIAFFNHAGAVAFAEDFDLSGFNSGGIGFITFRGQRFYVSGVLALFGVDYALDRLDRRFRNDPRGEVTVRWRINNNIVLNLFNYVPVINTSINIARISVSTINALETYVLNADARIELSDQEYISLRLAYVISILRGGVITIEVPGSYLLLGVTLETPQAMFNLAGLRHLDGRFTPEAVMTVLTTGREHEDWNIVDMFTIGRSQERSQFYSLIRGLLQTNIDSINTLFETDISRHESLNFLPRDVLTYLIDLALSAQ